jgi:hypothetical protein
VAAEDDGLTAPSRWLFQDTAYWNAELVTDAEAGLRTVPLPDNLTTWESMSVA